MKKNLVFLVSIIVMLLTFGVSVEAASLGESCSGSECAEGLVCRDFVCTRPAGEGRQGASCSTGAECATGFECRGNICVAADDTGGDSNASDDQTNAEGSGGEDDSSGSSGGGSAAGGASPQNFDRIEYFTYTSFPGFGRLTNLCQLSSSLWDLGLIVLIVGAFAKIVYAGFLYVTAGVNVASVGNSKKIFGDVVTGVVLGLSAVLILQVINPSLLSPSCDLQFVGSGTNAFENFQLGGGAGSGGSGGGNSGGPIGPAPEAGDIPAAIAAANEAYRGTSTVSGPDGGNKACAWAVNNILANAGLSKIGNNTNLVRSVEAGLQSGRGQQISQGEAVPGDLVISGPASHIGICVNNGCTRVLSNSSSRAAYVWESGFDYDGWYGSGSRVYRVLN